MVTFKFWCNDDKMDLSVPEETLFVTIPGTHIIMSCWKLSSEPLYECLAFFCQTFARYHWDFQQSFVAWHLPVWILIENIHFVASVFYVSVDSFSSVFSAAYGKNLQMLFFIYKNCGWKFYDEKPKKKRPSELNSFFNVMTLWSDNSTVKEINFSL